MKNKKENVQIAEMKIRGIKMLYSTSDLVIIDSYQIHNIKKMREILIEALDKAEDYMTDRNINSLINEWITHNIFYKLHLFRGKTKDCNLESKQKTILKIFYFIFSIVTRIKYGIKKFKNNKKIKKQEKNYKNYIKEHQENVRKAFEEIKENPVIYQRYSGEILDALWGRVLIHDKSKYSEEEFVPYRKNFYPINAEEKEENKLAFEKAWEHHWKNNSHHWQYRKNKISFDKNNKEEVLDILENILDWIAMGYKFNDRPYQYYENNKNNITLCEDERKYLEDLIYNVIDIDYIQKEDSDDNGTRE